VHGRQGIYGDIIPPTRWRAPGMPFLAVLPQNRDATGDESASEFPIQRDVFMEQQSK
jgi:hypothetical protein